MSLKSLLFDPTLFKKNRGHFFLCEGVLEKPHSKLTVQPLELFNY
jgi:hypothetical protein